MQEELVMGRGYESVGSSENLVWAPVREWEKSIGGRVNLSQPQALDSSLASLINDMWGKLIESRHTGPFQTICKIIFINILNVKDRGADK